LLALDLLGVFVFGLSGGLVAVRKGFDVLAVLMLAAAAGLGGGVLRDLLAGETPRLFAEREWYATPALLGATVYALAWSADLANPVTTWGCVVLITVLRILGMARGWQVPAAR